MLTTYNCINQSGFSVDLQTHCIQLSAQWLYPEFAPQTSSHSITKTGPILFPLSPDLLPHDCSISTNNILSYLILCRRARKAHCCQVVMTRTLQPRGLACPRFLASFTVSWQFAQIYVIESVMLYNHLVLCCPLLLLPSISQHQVFPVSLLFLQGCGQSIGAKLQHQLTSIEYFRVHY